ncbi:hypothetical protein F2P81_013777 [Scophthalmus maximus]|uniref:Uncharacterized protein n=1 Tax=Scophthalmus maximus TaxID=52904 RepID=A0A6A4SRR5_SCOMX|nr:hypothetical protein F2P81_013777 [Scophthalmus maximus]
MGSDKESVRVCEWVLAFEIFIPLVLFFILLGLRQKKPAIPVKEDFLALLFTRRSVTQLLERISEVVEQNRLFTSDRPGLGQELETLQRHLESLSSAPLPLDYNFNKSKGLNAQPFFI